MSDGVINKIHTTNFGLFFVPEQQYPIVPVRVNPFLENPPGNPRCEIRAAGETTGYSAAKSEVYLRS